MSVNSVICEYPNCPQRLFYRCAWQARLMSCTCGNERKYLCNDHEGTAEIICSICVTDIKNKTYNYIFHENYMEGFFYKYFKVDRDTYLKHLDVSELTGYSHKDRYWAVCRRKYANIFDIYKLYARELKPYTYVPLIENDMRRMPNNYANILPRDVIGIISGYLFYTM